MPLTLDDFNNLDVNNIGNWPITVKAVAILLICALALGAGYWFVTKAQLEQFDSLQREELGLRDEFRKKQLQANSLEELKEQLKKIEESFKELLKRLPSKTEVPDLLVDISQTGLANGLTFELFQPQGEREGEGGFYKELPIKLRMRGDFHSFGKFVSDISSLQRIVTQHDITITASPSTEGGLVMDATAKTYRYKEDEAE